MRIGRRRNAGLLAGSKVLSDVLERAEEERDYAISFLNDFDQAITAFQWSDIAGDVVRCRPYDMAAIHYHDSALTDLFTITGDGDAETTSTGLSLSIAAAESEVLLEEKYPALNYGAIMLQMAGLTSSAKPEGSGLVLALAFDSGVAGGGVCGDGANYIIAGFTGGSLVSKDEEVEADSPALIRLCSGAHPTTPSEDYISTLVFEEGASDWIGDISCAYNTNATFIEPIVFGLQTVSTETLSTIVHTIQ